MKFLITRTSEDTYRVDTDRMLADGSYQADGCLKLDGNRLRSFEKLGHIRVGGLISLKLGEQSLPRVKALKIGESVAL